MEVFENIIEHALESKLSYKYLIQMTYPENYSTMIIKFIDYLKLVNYPLGVNLAVDHLDLPEQTLFYIGIQTVFNEKFEGYFIDTYNNLIDQAGKKSKKTKTCISCDKVRNRNFFAEFKSCLNCRISQRMVDLTYNVNCKCLVCERCGDTLIGGTLALKLCVNCKRAKLANNEYQQCKRCDQFKEFSRFHSKSTGKLTVTCSDCKSKTIDDYLTF